MLHLHKVVTHAHLRLEPDNLVSLCILCQELAESIAILIADIHACFSKTTYFIANVHACYSYRLATTRYVYLDMLYTPTRAQPERRECTR